MPSVSRDDMQPAQTERELPSKASAKEKHPPEEDRVFDKEEERLLKELDFYHGFIPREDLQFLIKKDGDYLIRVSEVDTPASSHADGKTHHFKREIILSMFLDTDDHDVGPSAVEKKHRHQDGISSGVHSAEPTVSNLPTKRSKLKNAVIRRIAKGKYMLEPEKTFDSLKELVAHYQTNVGLLTVSKTRFLLKRPVKLHKWELHHEDIKLGKMIGEGAFGEVRMGIWQLNKTHTRDVAVKMTKGPGGTLCKAKIKEMMGEARLMRNLKHKNIVRLYGVACDEQPLYIVLELVKGGSLNSYLHRNKCTQEEKMNMCLGAARGINYVHQNGIIHRDLAARNCLYDKEHKLVKISDFGLSRCAQEYRLKAAVKLPIKWLAPETILTFVFTAKSDIWSYGVMTHEIFSDGAEPWEGCTNTEVKKAIIAGNTLPMRHSPEKVSNFIRIFGERVFARMPEARCDMAEVIRFLELQLDPAGASAAVASHGSEVKSDRAPDGSPKKERLLAEGASGGNRLIPVPSSTSATARLSDQTPRPVTRLEKSHRRGKK